jgi:hypothetical protein
MRFLTVATVDDGSKPMFQVIASDTALGAAERTTEVLPASEDPCKMYVQVYPEIPDAPDGVILFDFECQYFEMKERKAV